MRVCGQMLCLLSLACLLAVAAAEKYYYCNPNGTQVVRDTDFYLITTFQSAGGYEPGLTCHFSAESDSSVFFVEIQSFSVGTAVLSLSSGGITLFQGSHIQDYQTSITTPSKSLQVCFNATGDNSMRRGVTLRVRVLSFFGCPPDWEFLYRNCFGNSRTTGRLNFTDAQKACNNMRANLLVMPPTYYGSINSFVRALPANLRRTYTWIGLTDKTSYGRYIYYWLSGQRQPEKFDVSCVSGGSHTKCHSTERCGTINTLTPAYSIFMDACDNKRAFACSMPAGGAQTFYLVPDGSSTGVLDAPKKYWIWGIVIASVTVSGFAAVGLFTRMRIRSLREDGSAHGRRAAAGADGAAGFASAGCVTMPRPVNCHSRELQPPPYFAPPEPPTYEEATREGSGCTSFNK